MFLKNRNINSKIKRSKVTDYAALSTLFIKLVGMNLPLDCHEPGYQMKVFTLCQSLTLHILQQGNYPFLTIELVKTAIDQSNV